MTEIFNKQSQKGIRKNLRKGMPLGERLLWGKLKNKQLGYKFKRQFGIDKYIVDFYCPKLKLVIEVDGLTHEFKENITKDKIRQKSIESLGINVVRFNSKEIFDDLLNVVKQIYFICESLNKLPKTPSQPPPS